jgi:hypothetical protein
MAKEREQFGTMVKVLRSVGGSNPGLNLAVVTVSKSLYPHCFSYLTVKIRTWLRLGGKNICPIDSAKNLVRSRLVFRCQYHTSGAVNELLRVPSPAPGIMPNRWLIIPQKTDHLRKLDPTKNFQLYGKKDCSVQ